MMLESKAPILLVFYKVQPSELQRTRGICAQALQNLVEKKTHELKLQYDFNTINSGRNVVSLVADISRFVLEVCNG